MNLEQIRVTLRFLIRPYQELFATGEAMGHPEEPVSLASAAISGAAGDARYTLRSLRKNPGFTSIAVLTIALGIAANTAIFSVINTLFLHPPGVAHADHLVAIRVRYDKLSLKNISVSLTDFADIRDSKSVFSNAAATLPDNFNYTGGTVPERLLGARVTSQWFDTFGIRPLLGRGFTVAEDVPGAEHVAVLSYATWQRLFGKDPTIISKNIVLNDQSFRVIGVMGPEFNWPIQAQMWVPMGVAAKEFGPENRFNESYDAVARLAPGVSRQQAEAWVAMLSKRVASGSDDAGRYARSSMWGMFTESFSELIYGDLRAPLTVLAGTVGFVLLICCANVAGLMLARSSRRSRELAIRTALGARRVFLVRQLLLESFIIAGCGTLLGVGAAVVAVRNAGSIAPAGSIGNIEAPLDGTVLLFSIGAGVLSALIFGLAPAWSIASAKTFESLKEAGRSSMSGKGRQRMRSALVIAEVAIALVLLVGAGLFLKSFVRTQQLSPGFDARGVMTANISLDQHSYADKQKRAVFYTAIAQELAARNGIEDAGITYGLPFSDMGGSSSFAIEGRELGPGDPGPHSDIATATPGYFKALRIPLRAGRYFTAEDRQDSEPVAIIDDSLARQYWHEGNPIGARIKRGKEWTRIVGVVGHVNRSSLAADTGKGLTYYPQGQSPQTDAQIVARTSGDPAPIARSIRDAVRTIDPSQAAVYDLKPMSDLIAASLGPRRFAVSMLVAFSATALLMAVLGLYGVVSYSVSQRSQEIGVRMALGARLSQVLWMVISESMRLVVAGVAIGFVVSLALARLLGSQLVQISAFDPLTFASMCAVLVAVTLAATFIPARRAANIDPMVALRYE
jgi:predicted permease